MTLVDRLLNAKRAGLIWYEPVRGPCQKKGEENKCKKAGMLQSREKKKTLKQRFVSFLSACICKSDELK